MLTFAGGILTASVAASSSFVATTTADSGFGSLRWAIEEANLAPGYDEILFAIPGPGVQTIRPLTPLPSIDEQLTIRGSSQGSGYSIVLEGSQCSHPCNGLTVLGGESTIEGLVVYNFHRGAAISLQGTGDHTVARSRIGTDASGLIGYGNTTGVEVWSTNNSIENSLISESFFGIHMVPGSAWNTVRENIIGPNALGRGFAPNASIGQHWGVFIEDNSHHNRILGNRLTNYWTSIHVAPDSSHNVIQGNRIGVDRFGRPVSADNKNGIALWGDFNQVGGSGAGEANRIGFTYFSSILVMDNSPHGTASNNTIRRNLIHDVSWFQVAIELHPWGSGQNDYLDVDLGTNNGQNSPPIFDAFAYNGATQIRGYVQSAASQYYEVDVYSSPVDRGIGSCDAYTYVGTVGVWTDSGGDAFWHLTGPAIPVGHFVGATATDMLTGDTSEISVCVPVQ